VVSRSLRLWLLAALTGVAAGLIAIALLRLIGVVTNVVFFGRIGTSIPDIVHPWLGPLIVVVPIIGGLVVGLMARYGTPQIKGHGIPEAMEAILTRDSRVSPRVALYKPLSIVVAIGTGGPFGAEGPIIQTGGAIGSLMGQILSLSPIERRILLGCGAAGGMAAVFGTPVAAVVLAVELLLFEYRTRSLVPLAITAVVATSVRYGLTGSGPLFAVGDVRFGLPGTMPWYIMFGVLCGVLAVAATHLLYRVEDAFDRLPVNEMLKPALGGVALGIIGLSVPRVLGVGYGTIEALLNNHLAVAIVVLVFVFKFVALILSLGAGTSGGLLAPLFMTGAALGILFADLANLTGMGALDPRAFAVTGMAAIFGAAARTPFALIIFAFEITQDYDAVLPLMLVVVIAVGVAEFMQPHDTIMTRKLVRRGLRVPQGYEADPLTMVTVGEVLAPAPCTVAPNTPLSELTRLWLTRSPDDGARGAFAAVVDDDGMLVGLITQTDILRASNQAATDDDRSAQDIAATELVFIGQDQTLRDAAEAMLLNGVGHLPVEDSRRPGAARGFVTHRDLLEGHRRRHTQEMAPGRAVRAAPG